MYSLYSLAVYGLMYRQSQLPSRFLAYNIAYNETSEKCLYIVKRQW